MTPEQCKAARAFINMNQPDLAKKAGVSPSTLRDFEAGRRRPIANNLAALQSALEGAGITFLAAGDVAVGPGVSLRPVA